MLILSQIIGLAYIIIMGYFAIGFRKSLRRNKEINFSKKIIDFSAIIPFRNEKNAIPTLIRSLKLIDMPRARVKFIFVDDSSEDGSKDILLNLLYDFPFEYEVLQNQGTGKKEALQTGIDQVKTKWIVCTDADSEYPNTWLTSIENKLGNTNAEMLVMPIQLKSDDNFFGDIQKLESAALVSMSAGALANQNVFSANGANLAFTKNIFEKVGGYAPEMHLASGDDEFLLKRVFDLNKDLVEDFFIKEVLIKTNSCKTFSNLISQRTRWVSKVKFEKLTKKQLPIIIPSLFMVVLMISLPISILSSYNLISAGLLTNKWIGDFLLFFSFARFFGYSFKEYPKLILLILVLPIYQVAYMIPVMVNKFTGKFTWKGRSYQI